MQQEVWKCALSAGDRGRLKNKTKSLCCALKPSSKGSFMFLDYIIHHLKCLRIVAVMWPTVESPDGPMEAVLAAAGFGNTQCRALWGWYTPISMRLSAGCLWSTSALLQGGPPMGQAESPVHRKRNIPENSRLRTVRACNIRAHQFGAGALCHCWMSIHRESSRGGDRSSSLPFHCLQEQPCCSHPPHHCFIGKTNSICYWLVVIRSGKRILHSSWRHTELGRGWLCSWSLLWQACHLVCVLNVREKYLK